MELKVKRLGAFYPVLFDEADAGLILGFRWYIKPNGADRKYAITPWVKPDGHLTSISMHLLLTGSEHDHINRNGLDNRRANLRPATRSQNNANQPPRGGASPYKGVHKAWGKKWAAGIRVDRRQHHLGTFANQEDAARAYDRAAVIAWGAYAWLNFPNQG